ncbi:MAG: hypothetical protein ACJ8C4_05610 [Gemmataceae bacterium]
MTMTWLNNARRIFRRSTVSPRGKWRWSLMNLEKREVPAAFASGDLAVIPSHGQRE